MKLYGQGGQKTFRPIKTSRAAKFPFLTRFEGEFPDKKFKELRGTTAHIRSTDGEVSAGINPKPYYEIPYQLSVIQLDKELSSISARNKGLTAGDYFGEIQKNYNSGSGAYVIVNRSRESRGRLPAFMFPAEEAIQALLTFPPDVEVTSYVSQAGEEKQLGRLVFSSTEGYVTIKGVPLQAIPTSMTSLLGQVDAP